jgi:tetratricopeptide (TPR) repeat protein
MDEAEENNLGLKAKQARWDRWYSCSLCEQRYHGVVWCALGWACWKTYVGRSERDGRRCDAMNLLGNGLSAANHDEDALSVREAELSLKLRLGDTEGNILVVQGNLAMTYQDLGRVDEALPLRQEVYSGRLKLNGEEHESTLIAANNYAYSLNSLQRFEEAKALLRQTMPVARRVLGESDHLTLSMRSVYASALYRDDAATLDDLREAVSTLEDAERTARRVLGGSHPCTGTIETALRGARAALISALQAATEK